MLVLKAIAVLLLISACSRKPMDVSPPLVIPGEFSAEGEPEIPTKWWTVFNDPALDSLADSAFASNFSILTAWERLSAAHAVVDRESSAFFPDIYAAVRGETGSGQTGFEVNDNVRIDLNTDYEIDLRGRIRSAVDAERFRTDASASGYQAASILNYQPMKLKNKRIALLIAEGVEDLEFYVPLMRFREEGADVFAAAKDLGPINGKNGLEIQPERPCDQHRL